MALVQEETLERFFKKQSDFGKEGTYTLYEKENGNDFAVSIRELHRLKKLHFIDIFGKTLAADLAAIKGLPQKFQNQFDNKSGLYFKLFPKKIFVS